MSADVGLDPIPWASFAVTLASALRGLPDDGTFVLCRDEGETDEFDLPSTPKYVQFARFGHDMLRCEVVADVFLPDEHRWTSTQEDALVRMGWQRPDPDEPTASPNWYLDVRLLWVELAFERVVRVLRDLWGAREMSDVALDEEELRRFRWIDAPEDLEDDPGR